MAHPPHPDLRSLLKNSLANATRIAVLGIGSEYRGDDAAGVMAAERLAKRSSPRKNVALKIFNGATAPENLTGEIKRFKPSHLVIIDTIDAGQKPGTILIVEPDIIGGATFSTHSMPAHILADYLGTATGCKTVIIGIQGKSIAFGSAMAKSVRGSVSYVVQAFMKSL